MKRLILASAIMINAGAALAADATTSSTTTPAAATAPAAASSTTLSNEDAKIGYSIGYITGKSNSEQLPTLDIDSYVAGFRDAYTKKNPALSDDDMKATLTAFRQKMIEAAQAKEKQEADDNAKKGADYLAANAQKAGVKTTASGLQYEVLSEGKGAKPKATDTVKVTYEGKLLDGTVFDSTAQHGGDPVTFPLNQVIPGWTEGLQLMSVGSKYRFTIPSSLGYGEQRNGPIPANAVLVFDVELLAIEKAETKPAAGSKKKKAAE